MAFGEPNSATTISLKFRPGENKRLLGSNSEAIFSYGDFRIERNLESNSLSGNTDGLSFGAFSTLETLNATQFETNTLMTSVSEKELNLPAEDPTSHVYFSSFYTEVATSINNIIENFPYAILSWNDGNTNIFNYSEDVNNITGETISTFSIYFSALTNQGNITINSGNTENNLSLVHDYTKFVIQLSGYSDSYRIRSYSFSGGHLTFSIIGSIFDPLTTDSDLALYIKPTPERLNDYYNEISSLEYQLLANGELSIPDPETAADDSYLQEFIWPRTIDGFAPDNDGVDFETYKDAILKASEIIDEEKTNIFIKTIIPENYLQYDSDNMIYRTLIQTYAHEFDKLKKFIDAMAYAHSINYNNKESIPSKYLMKLSNLLGWQLSDSFSELDLFEYLTSNVDENENSYSHFNVEIWKRILVNIVWLYKKKGTRDGLMFIFKLLGAPDCLVNFNEFVYDMERIITTPPVGAIGTVQANLLRQNNTLVAFTTRTTSFTTPTISQGGFISSTPVSPVQPVVPGINPPGGSGIVSPITPGSFSSTTIVPIIINPPTNQNTDKIDDYGFVNYNVSKWHFQKGGENRGDGQDYINQWRPEFNPIKRLDNIKVQSGNTDLRIGTKSIMNTKEVEISYSPAKAIECDVFDFYKNDCSCWTWGSTCVPFSAMTVPFEYLSFECSVVSPPNIYDMTLSEYMDYVFTNAIDPRNRKTNAQCHNTWGYPELKNIYLNYYFSTNPEGNHLTMGKLEAYLDLIGIHLGDYMSQLIPATTIFNGEGSITYRNPLFHRQRFVYKEGIHEGSMFQTNFPADLNPAVNITQIGLDVPDINEGTLTISNQNMVVEDTKTLDVSPIVISSSVPYVHSVSNSVYNITMEVIETLITEVPGWTIENSVAGESESRLYNVEELT